MSTQNTPYIVGKYYDIPTVRGTLYTELRDWPVMGGLHEDRELLGFEYFHYHIDWRFVSQRDFMMRHIQFKRFYSSVYAVPLMTNARINTTGLPKPVIKRLRCKREHNLPHNAWAKPSWCAKIESAYTDCKLKNNICPHRGFDLSHEPVSADGIVTCPLHGLRWHVETGDLVITPAKT